MYPDDASTKYRRGEAHARATMTNAVARAIYRTWQAHRQEWGIQTRLAHTFGVSQTVVHSIVHRRSWRVATQEED